jgi:hypothetical protein
VKTLTVDDYKRIRIPVATPRQVYALADHGNGSFRLTLVKAKTGEPFPPGSLDKFMTPERDKEQLALLNGCTLERP